MEGSPNLLAYLALALSPLVSMVLMATMRAPLACAVGVLAAQMFLPPVFELDAPVIPPLGKDVLPLWGLVIGCLLFRRKALAGARPFRGYEVLILLQIAGHFGTFLTNKDPVIVGRFTLPGLTLYDAFSEAMKTLLYWWPPLFLGRTLFRTPKDVKLLLGVVAGAGAIYSFFLFVEMLFSPQLNRWFYGYHQSEFLQTIRWGGYRPKAFMRHGLNVALFVLVTLIAATGLARAGRTRLGGVVPASWVSRYLAVVLVACKSLGALLYGVFALPFLWFAKAKRQAKIISILALIIFCYPLVRWAGILPVEDILAFTARKFGADRSGSLGVRLHEEAYVLGRALLRLPFGWGGYGRPFSHDLWTGKQTTIIDGYWVLTLSAQGAVGYLSVFGLLLLPLWRLRKTVAGLNNRNDRLLVTTLGFAMVVFVFDLIPNSTIDPYLLLMLGALIGSERWPAMLAEEEALSHLVLAEGLAEELPPAGG
jgi:4-amino-4-deoxy-L-arabinose transferase-like glycosyltransferase